MRTVIKKLDEDDILEILIEHFQTGQYSYGRGKLIGTPGNDLRFVGAISCDSLADVDLDEIDKKYDYDGDHSFIKNNPEFDLSNMYEEL